MSKWIVDYYNGQITFIEASTSQEAFEKAMVKYPGRQVRSIRPSGFWAFIRVFMGQ